MIKQSGFKYINFRQKLDSKANIADNQLGLGLKEDLKDFVQNTLLKKA